MVLCVCVCAENGQASVQVRGTNDVVWHFLDYVKKWLMPHAGTG